MSVEDSSSSTNDTQEVTDSVKTTEEENTTSVENDTTNNNENETETENETSVNEGGEEMEAPPPPPPPKMPENTVWEACWDENSKNYYYWNTETDEVTWDNPFEGEVETEGKEEKDDKDNDDNDDSENYEIEVEGYEEALAEQQKRQQEEEKAKEKEKINEDTTATTATTTTTMNPSAQSAYAYTNPADPNYYYGYGGYDYSQYASYYGQYNYGAYPTDYSAPADKDTLSNFDSLLNKIDDAKEKLDDLAGTDKDKKKDDKKEEEKKENDDKSKEEDKEAAPAATSYADYWNYPQYTYPTTDTSAAAGTGQFQEYSVTGYFNKRTGRFQQTTNEMMANPQDYFTPESKGERQMQYFFNPEAYQQHYNDLHHTGSGEDASGKGGKRKLTRKEIEHFKKMKKQKRDDKLKRKYMD